MHNWSNRGTKHENQKNKKRLEPSTAWRSRHLEEGEARLGDFGEENQEQGLIPKVLKVLR